MRGCGARARFIRNGLGMQPRNAGDARVAGDARHKAASESVGDAGNAAGLLHIRSVLSLFPTRAPMAARAVVMRQRRLTADDAARQGRIYQADV